MPALALTDHHGLYGAVRFFHAAAQASSRSSAWRSASAEEHDTCRKPHLVLLAKSRATPISAASSPGPNSTIRTTPRSRSADLAPQPEGSSRSPAAAAARFRRSPTANGRGHSPRPVAIPISSASTSGSSSSTIFCRTTTPWSTRCSMSPREQTTHPRQRCPLCLPR